MVISGPGIKPGSSFEFVASNVDTMPTALGLAGIPTPASMDGRSFAHLLLTNLEEAPPPARSLLASAASPAAWRTDQLIEYGGGGPVVRYEHLEDIHNNTFRCLRCAPQPRNSRCDSDSLTDGGCSGCSVVDPSAAAAGLSDAKLCEFVGWADWNFTSGGADSEYELFDLAEDPFELRNLWASEGSGRGAALKKRLDALYTCAGASCN